MGWRCLIRCRKKVKKVGQEVVLSAAIGVYQLQAVGDPENASAANQTDTYMTNVFESST